ncbi:hypothetical protein M9H77_17701 [Catharanthus roseus]|uniref:Uncharacterized protein n=1 Tax=Catharanthus roseus TaxID=4058 RepID=A0ACC0B5C4_CATRO|nr:hypothetical protein M9H77_17701 [Catharanthus roseus]
MENQIELLARMFVEKSLNNAPSNTVTLQDVEEQEPKESTPQGFQEPLSNTIIVEQKILLLVLSILQENEDYQQDRSSLGPSSSQLVEDDDEADKSYNPSDDEEDEASAQNTVPIYAFQTEMQTAFEQP